MATLKVKILFWIAVSGVLFLMSAYMIESGYSKGYAAASEKCQEQNIEQLTQMLNTTEQLTRDANAASLALGKTISERITTDNQITQDIRHALSTTAHLRVECKLDDSIMRQLAAARTRANQAAASGITSAVPSAP